MTLKEAERRVQRYGAALARGTGGGFARRQSWLPETPDKIISAFELTLAFLVENGSLTQDTADQLLGSIVFANIR